MSKKGAEYRAAYHLLWVLYQYCGEQEYGYVCKTRYNADGCAVDYLARKGYVRLINGEWPRTKFIKFEITGAGREVMGIEAAQDVRQ